MIKSQDYANCWFRMVYKSMHPYSSGCLIGGIKKALNLCINSAIYNVFAIMQKLLIWHSTTQSTSITLHKCYPSILLPLAPMLTLMQNAKVLLIGIFNTQKYKCVSNKKANHLTVVGFGYTAG